MAEKYGPFGNMTSNQAIVLNQLSKPWHSDITSDSAAQAIKDVADGVEKVDVTQLTVDWMVSVL